MPTEPKRDPYIDPQKGDVLKWTDGSVQRQALVAFRTKESVFYDPIPLAARVRVSIEDWQAQWAARKGETDGD